MRIHAIIHAPFEQLGAIEPWILKNNHQLTSTRIYDNEKLPDVDQFDFLILMGGPQTPLRLDKYPYLRDEIELAEQAIGKNKVVFGICLGAQLIGEALGARTERSPNRETGVYPIFTTPEGEKDPLFKTFGKQFDVMHWHNDMPGISKESVLLAASEGCPRQAFRYGDRAYGFQFHLEMTSDSIKTMIEQCAEYLPPGKYVQSPDQLLASRCEPINYKMHATLDYLASKVTSI
ncbi:MAG: GMP synthase [Deltaproteobacteria bacterium RIFCSPLOWO2_02_FULL_44_10]|nr:MAG: GMP synthase [Deltaproteobacteria bacterium RIFCSPHIGHO2_02_FULL_44_16]OGQ47334.1 MAG: GMP synthase [Deltaproteobacteria bacterium RIFCSPLOWO2_02_FULL_44_10]